MKKQNLAKRKPLFLKYIYLRNFRNYEEASVSFGPRLNVIFGSNGNGKTNLLEAISLLSTGRSFRTQHLSELILDGKNFFYIEAVIDKDRVVQTVKMTFDGNAKKVSLGSNEFASFTPMLGTFPSIFSLPEDTDLISDAPAHRRKFLNLHLSQSDPLYVHHLARFWRAMKQRNCLLKTKTMDSLDCWESEMAQSAEYIYFARQALIERLKVPILEQGKRLTFNRESIEMIFEPSYLPRSSDYMAQLKKMRGREKDLGATILGPHRDDVRFMINDKLARTYASIGQKKTIVTALRLSQWDHLTKQSEEPPLFAIDDFEGTLDVDRQEHLNASFRSMGQIFLTTPRFPINAPEANEHHICISQGNVVAEKIL